MENSLAQDRWTRLVENKVKNLKHYPVDVLLVGATGAGKSSTINALFGKNLAEVGHTPNPQTMLVEAYRLGNSLRFWDSPGLGDGVADTNHRRALTDILAETYRHSDGAWGFIDLVMVVLDASSRDMGTVYQLLEQVILRNIEPERVMVVLNQADLAMKGRHWNHQTAQPDDELSLFLKEKSKSVRQRLLEATGMVVDMPVCYSAETGYHLDELVRHLVTHIPTGKRKMTRGRGYWDARWA